MKKFKLFEKEFYKRLGFKAGLEIHYQLKTDKKLFCRCPAVLRSEKPDALILRHMRPTLSELGEYDGTALMEFKTKKNVFYELYRDSVCTYEMDDTPPFEINKDALKIAIEIALMLNCSLVDELHITRKQYLDGSIPTGFQRTAIVGVEGYVELLSGKKIGISHICLEEDACREVKDEGHNIIFKTDRLSFPLVEVITKAEIETPQEAAEVALRIGNILRATGKVRRGIGTVRQDVNLSISGGVRNEIKGVSKISYIPYLLHCEALRQHNLLKIKDELRARGITKDKLKTKIKNLNEVFQKTQNPHLKKALEEGKDIRGICLYGFGGLLQKEIEPGVPFEREFKGRVRVIACLDKPPILLHTDEEPVPFSENEMESLRHIFNFKKADAVLVLWGDEEDTKTAVEEIRIRAEEATQGVPQETRQALPDLTTDFERILPGPDRMYPDTDSPPTKITKEMVEEILKNLSENPLSLERKYLKLGLPPDWAYLLSISFYNKYFEEFLKEKIPPKIAGRIFVVERGLLKNIDFVKYKEKIKKILLQIQKGEVSFEYLRKNLKKGFKGFSLRGAEKDLIKKAKEIISKEKGISKEKLIAILKAKGKKNFEPFQIIKNLGAKYGR
ncbi:MAG: Glu-tRNA(Gln) amidotransferase subunit GatE [Thermoanaerobaculia bacterium]